jgi:hypothetical protein
MRVLTSPRREWNRSRQETMVTRALLTAKDGPDVIHTIDRPTAGNAINLEVATALRDAAKEAIGDPGCAALVLAASGRVFCAGATSPASPARPTCGATCVSWRSPSTRRWRCCASRGSSSWRRSPARRPGAASRWRLTPTWWWRGRARASSRPTRPWGSPRYRAVLSAAPRGWRAPRHRARAARPDA